MKLEPVYMTSFCEFHCLFRPWKSDTCTTCTESDEVLAQNFDPNIDTEAVTLHPVLPPPPPPRLPSAQQKSSSHSFGSEETQVVKRELNDRLREFLVLFARERPGGCLGRMGFFLEFHVSYQEYYLL